MRLASIFVAGLLCGLGRPAQAGFQRQALSVPGAVLSLTHGDLDGDGYTDLVVSYRRGSGPRATRYFGIFFRGPEGYPAKPQVAYAVPQGTSAFDVGDAVGDARDELVFLASTGVFVQRFEGRKPMPAERLLSVSSLVSGPEEEDLVAWDFLKQPKGLPSLLVLPGRRNLKVYQRGAEGWKAWANLRVGLMSYYDAETSTYRRSGRGGASGRPYAFRVTTIVPNLEWVDQTGDGRVDLVTFYEDRVQVFAQDAEGHLSPTPTFKRWFQMLTADELESRDVRTSAKVLDLDGDGIADLALEKIGGGITTLRAEVRLYRGLKGGGFSDKPAQVFADDGFAALSDFIDVDGDGALEMVHPHSEVSIMTMSGALISKSLDLDVRVREAAKGGLFFEPKPVQILETSYGLDFSVGAAIRGAAPIFGHDFTGDGRPDVLLSDGGEAIALLEGTGAQPAHFNEDAKVKLDVQGSNTTLAVCARPADPKVDIVVFYIARKSLAGQIFVFVPKVL